MHPILIKIRSAIKGTEFEGKVYIAGGYVRSLVMHKTPNDIDIVVELPDGGIKLANYLFNYFQGSITTNVTHPVIFARFGTAQMVIDDEDIEFVMSRRESYIPGSRKPIEVMFGTIAEDAARRDFTINTLLLNISTQQIIDPLGTALDDISLGLIKLSNRPEEIFGEDPLRMLRAIRFACSLGFNIDPFTWHAIERSASTLVNISSERIRDELVKIVMSDDPKRGIDMLITSGLSKIFLPEMILLQGLEQGRHHRHDAYEHTTHVLSYVRPDPLLRMAALLHDIAKPNTISIEEGQVHFYAHAKESATMAHDIMMRLKFSYSEAASAAAIIREHMSIMGTKGYTPKLVRRLYRELGDEIFYKLIELREADGKDHIDLQVSSFREFADSVLADDRAQKVAIKPPVDGFDIMTAFSIQPGVKVGELLKRAMDLYLETPTLTKADILNVLRTEIS